MAGESKNYLTESEAARFLKAARRTKHGVRDFALMLMCYRHGFRVSELIDIRLSELDLEGAHVHVRRLKGSRSTQQTLEGDEMRALRAWIRERSLTAFAGSPFLFVGERGPFTRQAVNYLVRMIGERAGLVVHPHMLRHSFGYAMANRGHDTRLIQDALGHKNIRHTVRYTETAPNRFEGLWRNRKA